MEIFDGFFLYLTVLMTVIIVVWSLGEFFKEDHPVVETVNKPLTYAMVGTGFGMIMFAIYMILKARGVFG